MAGLGALLAFVLSQGEAVFLRGNQETCSALKNHEMYSTVLTSIGTPAQNFNLVADTGSDDVIVQSCACKHSGDCPKEFGRCFTGANKSSSFLMKTNKHNEPPAMLMSFGSGQIASYLATDVVRVGHAKATMTDSLLLMVKQGLRIAGPFEGILGLGRPQAKNTSSEKEDIKVLGFLELAGINRFSMCFNYESDGVLGLNTASQATTLSSVGQMHWGVDFQGLSVGDAQGKVLFCDPSKKQEHQETACGLIPDSGTTLMMGPQAHVDKLYKSLCENWERCKKAHDALNEELKKMNKQALLQSGSLTPGDASQKDLDDLLKQISDALRGVGSGGSGGYGMGGLGDYGLGYGSGYSGMSSTGTQHVSMSETFQLLLENCEKWMHKNISLDDEMPAVTFHVAGANGKKQDLPMKPVSYILETVQKVAHKQIKNLLGIFPVEQVVETKEKVCMPAFGAQDFKTQKNGDVWIMGTPLFYEYGIHYDRRPTPPTMAFVPAAQEPCGKCDDGKIKKSESALLSVTSSASKLRKLASDPVIRQIAVPAF